ncbi:MAG: PAS domain S-box protein [Theionarchaea archaeon]|nr:PAS domain S-box protein [Theionarchaea archaeon]
MVKTLIVEDEGIVAKDMKNRLERLGYAVVAMVSSGEEALKKVEEMCPDVVLMDIVLKGEMNGIEAAEQIRTQFNIPVVYVTAYADENTLQRAKITEPYGYILKPIGDRELHIAIEMALYKHEMEKRVQESEQWLFTTLKSIGDVVIATDTQGLVTFMNPVAETLTGWTRKDAVGRPLDDILTIVDEETGRKIENPAQRVLQGIAQEIDHKMLTKNGVKIHIDESAALIKDDKGTIIGVVVVLRDITKRTRAERTLERTEKKYKVGQQELKELKQMEKALRESEKKYRELVESIDEIVYTIDSKGAITYVSPALTSITGYQPLEIIDRSFTEFVYPEDLDYFTEVFHTILSGQVCPGKGRIVTKSGKIRWVRFSSRPILVAGSVTGLRGMFTDITEQKRAEEALRASEDRYRQLFEDSPISLWEEDFSGVKKYVSTLRDSGVKDFATYFEEHPEDVAHCAQIVKVVDVNEATLTLYKAKSKEDFRHGLGTVFGKESYDVFKEELITLAEGETSFESEAVTYSVTGEKIPIDIRWSVAPGYEESLSKVLVSIVDITERKKAEEAIRESEEKYRTFVRNLKGIAYKGGMDWIPLFFHGAVKEITGYSEQEFLAGTPRWDQVIHPGDWPAFAESVEKLETIPNYSTSREYRIICKDNEVRWVQEFIQNICDSSQNPIYVQGMIYDITERKKAEEQLMQLSAAVKMSSDSIVITDTHGHIIDANEPALALYCTHERGDVIGSPLTDSVAPEDRQKVLACIEEVLTRGYCKNQEYDIIVKDGTKITVETNMALIKTAEETPGGIVCISRDITERKKVEKEIKKKLMKYDLEEGTTYLVRERVPCTSVEAFQDLLSVGYSGFVISRTPKWEFKDRFEQEFNYLWIAEKGDEYSIPPKLGGIQGKIETLTTATAIFIDGLDYLMSKTSFEEILSLVQTLREIAYLKNHVIILSVDPLTLDRRELALLEKETLSVEPLVKTKLPEELVEVLRVVYEQDTKGVSPSYTVVGQKIEASKPTTRKRIRTLISYGYLEESKKGRTKVIILTEKGRTLFLK